MGLGFEHRSSCCHLFCVYFLTLRSHSFVSLAVVVKRTFPSSLLLHWGIDVKGFPEQVGWLISNYKDSKMVRIFHPCSLVHPPTHTHTHTCTHTHTPCSGDCPYNSTILPPRRYFKCVWSLSDFSGMHMCASGDSIWLVEKK